MGAKGLKSIGQSVTNKGVGLVSTKLFSLGRIFSALSELFFLLMILLLAKGWTVVRSVNININILILRTICCFV